MALVLQILLLWLLIIVIIHGYFYPHSLPSQMAQVGSSWPIIQPPSLINNLIVQFHQTKLRATIVCLFPSNWYHQMVYSNYLLFWIHTLHIISFFYWLLFDVFPFSIFFIVNILTWASEWLWQAPPRCQGWPAFFLFLVHRLLVP